MYRVAENNEDWSQTITLLSERDTAYGMAETRSKLEYVDFVTVSTTNDIRIRVYKKGRML